MRRMMALANLLFGFFSTHAGSDAGAADLRMLPSALASSCAGVSAWAGWCVSLGRVVVEHLRASYRAHARQHAATSLTFNIPLCASLAMAAEKSLCVG
jgi:hypothetical protein